MRSFVLRTAMRFLLPLMLLFSIFLLLRGHNEPGGGFIAGLLSAAGFALYGLAHSIRTARSNLQIDPHILIGLGLILALISGLFPTLFGYPFLTGQWFSFTLPVWGKVDFGTPLFFDIGVFLAVWGVALMILFALMEE